MKNTRKTLHFSRETIRLLSHTSLKNVAGAVHSGSQPDTGSATCPPPKNGEGSGCLTE
jgi:hypothetical protein